MQQQRSVVDSFPETVDLNQGSVSNNTGMNQSTAWDSIPNPTESRLLNYMLSSGEGNYTGTNPVSHNVRSFSGWDSGESSSGVNMNNQVIGDGLEMEHGRSSVFGVCAGVDTRSVERRFEQSNILPHQSVNTGPSGNQAAAPSTMQCSSSNNNNLNVNLNAGYVDIGHDEQAMGAGACPNLYKLSGSRAEQISSTRASCDDVGTSSGTSGYLVEKDGGSDSPLGSWSSCKRKALEVNSGQSYTGGSSSCFSQAENIARHSVPVRHSASSSLSISSPPMSSPSAGVTEQLNPRIGVGTRGAISDVFPPLSVTENSPRNFGATVNQGYHEPIQFNIPPGNATRHSNVCPPHQSSRSLSFTDSLDFRSTASAANNSSIHRNQFHSIHVPELSRNVLPFPWNGALNSRGGTSSTSLMLSGERGAPLRDEANFRNNQRNNTDHPMFVPATEMRNFVQEPTNWSLASGNSSTSRGVPSSSQIGPSSSVCPPSTAWMPHSTPQTQNQQRRSEFSPWTLFPTFDSESGGQRNNFPPLHAGPSSSSEEISMSPGASSRVHHSPHPRSALMMEFPGGDDVNGWRVLAADIEGRQRLVTEIRQVLNAMRRGENLRAEDYMLFDPFINGVAELHDRHRDMRLDVDNMSYEELLALEERIGNVNTGLSEETIFQAMQQRKHLSIAEGPVPNLEPCCICREDYCPGDDIGTLDCNHDFHVNCIKQWLIQKNLCPICKMKALDA